MIFPLFIARKYFLSKERKSFINIVSILSLLIILAASAAMVIVLSVFNGFTEQLKGIHQTFDAEIVIVPKTGKTFSRNQQLLDEIQNLKDVLAVTEVIEDDAYLESNEYQKLGRFKGVTDNYIIQNGMQDVIIGQSDLRKGDYFYAVIGNGVRASLRLRPGDPNNGLRLLYPKRTEILRDVNSLNAANCLVGGVFQIERQYDENYVIIPIVLAESLTNNKGFRSSYEIKATPSSDLPALKEKLNDLLPNGMIAELGEERHKSLYRAIKIEKLIAFIVLVMILAVASINLYIIVSMMIVSKKRDVNILMALGAELKSIRLIFIFEALMIVSLGTGLGLLIGWGICFAQLHFGLFEMGAETALISAFPILMKASDFVFIGIASLIICTLISILPIKRVKAY